MMSLSGEGFVTDEKHSATDEKRTMSWMKNNVTYEKRTMSRMKNNVTDEKQTMSRMRKKATIDRMAPAHQSITENATVQHVLHLSQNATRCSIRSQSCGSDCGQKGVIKSCLVERHAQERTCLPEKFPYTVFLARCSEKTDKRYRSN